MTLLEAGSASAVALGLGCFALLVIAAVTAGFALLARLTFTTDPRVRLLLAPFAATVAWALTGNLMVRMGFTMAQVTPLVAFASLGLAAAGIRSMARARLRPAAVCGLLAGPVALTLFVMQASVARGLTAHLGSPNLDTVIYTDVAAAYWRYGLDTLTGRPRFFQNIGNFLGSLGSTRNHTFVLLAFFSPLVKSGEPLLVRNVFVCWSLFVLACSLAFYYRASWHRESVRLLDSWWTTLMYVNLTVGIGWVAVPALVGNWDNALFASVGPVLAALAGAGTKGWANRANPVFLGAVVAYGAYTYPELAPFLGLLLVPFYLRPLCDPTTRAACLRAYGVSAITAAVLLSIGARQILVYFQRQLDASHVTVGMRPGGNFGRGLADTPLDPAAWWALGAEHGPAGIGFSWPSLLGGLLTIIALIGVWTLWRRQRWAEISSLGFLGGVVAYFVFVDRYGYAGYKLLSVSWWLIGLCLSEGTISVIALVRAGCASRWPVRVLRWSAAGAVALVLTVGLAVEHLHQRNIYLADSYFERQPTVASMMRIARAAMNQPRTDVLVMEPFTDDFALPWVYYALKDTPLRAYQPANLTTPVPGGERWASDRGVPQHVLIRPESVNGTPARFTTPEFALVDLRSAVYVEHVDNPNGVEPWGNWLGDKAITISLLAGTRLPVSLSFFAHPGPGIPETSRRTLELSAGSRSLGRIEIDGSTRVTIPFVTAGGREVVTLSTPDAVTLARMPNGDTRPLLVRITSLNVVAAPHPG